MKSPQAEKVNKSPTRSSLLRRFHPTVRGELEAAMDLDRTGRLEQLAGCVPGALAFAVAHASFGDETSRDVVAGFFSEVASGRPLKRALEPLLEDWSLVFGRNHPTDGLRRALARIAALPVEARRAQICRQRILLWRAVPGIPGEHLWSPAPEIFVPEHIPSTTRVQQRWFRAMAAMAHFHGGLQGPKPQVYGAFLRWLSAHAGEPGRDHWPPQALFLAVQRRGCVVPPGMSLTALVAQVDAWWDEEQRQRLPEMEPQPEPLEELDGLEQVPWDGPYEELALVPPVRRKTWPDTLAELARAFPDRETRDARGRRDLFLPTPFAGCVEPELTVRPLGRASELREEGRAMQHCVARYVELAVGGEGFFFHAVARGMPLTVHVRGPAERAWLQQVLGHRNRTPAAEREALVRAWWERGAHAHALPLDPPATPLPDCPF